jgi:hypothetical protein
MNAWSGTIVAWVYWTGGAANQPPLKVLKVSKAEGSTSIAAAERPRRRHAPIALVLLDHLWRRPWLWHSVVSGGGRSGVTHRTSPSAEGLALCGNRTCSEVRSWIAIAPALCLPQRRFERFLGEAGSSNVELPSDRFLELVGTVSTAPAEGLPRAFCYALMIKA